MNHPGWTVPLLLVQLALTCGLIITSPSSIAGSYASLRSSFSGVLLPYSASPVTSDLVLANPCLPITIPVTGKIVFSSMDAGACIYYTQAQNVISAGGVGLVLAKTSPTFVVLPMLYTASKDTTSIPCISVSGVDGARIRAQLQLNVTVTASIGYTPAIAEQKQALLDLWGATAGATWRFGASGQYNAWSTNTDPCGAWYGVACDDNTGAVLVLALPLNTLVGTIPTSIAQLTSLTQVQLSANTGLTSLPSAMFEFPMLISLEASGDGLTSTISSNIGIMTNLKTLNLASNKMTGAIPDSFTQLTSLVTCQLNGNAFTGSIPAAIGNLAKTTQLSFSSNKMSGSVPSSIGGMTALTRLEIARNAFGGDLPSSLAQLTSLAFLDISDNTFSGSMPSQIVALTKLTYLNVARNSLTGNVPSLSTAVAMQVMDISYNQFTGALDGSSFPSVLTALRASHNQFTSIINFSTKKALLTADVSYNSLQWISDLYALPRTTTDDINNGISGLTTIDLSHNHMKNLTALFDLSLEFWPSLTSISLAYNELGGSLAPPASASTSKYLRSIDVSYNRVQGYIPDVYGQLPSLTSFDLRNNSLYHGSAPLIPSFANASYETLFDFAAGSAFCPSFTSSSKLNLYIDHSYHDYLLCQCKTNYRRALGVVPLSCLSCPLHLICDENRLNDTYFFYEAEWYPTPSILEPVAMIPCPNCKKDTSQEFGCKVGYEGRICSRCNDGYYLRGSRCEKCQPSGLVLFVVVVVIVVAIIVYFAILYSRFARGELITTTSIEFIARAPTAGVGVRSEAPTLHTISVTPSPPKRSDSSSTTSSTSSSGAFLPPNPDPPLPTAKGKVTLFKRISFQPSLAIITIIINYTQTLSILCRFFSLDYSLKQLLGIAEVANVSGTGFGFECIADALAATHARYLLTSLQPIFVTGVCGVLAVFGVAIIRVILRQNYRWWLIVCGRILFFLLDFLFFPVLITCISIFKCEEDPVTHVSYLSEYPYSKCSSVAVTEKAWFLVCNIVGIYGLFIFLLVLVKRSKVKLIRVRVHTMFGFFYSPYRPEFFYGGIFYLTRRLIFSILNGLLDTTSLNLFISNMVFICFSIILVYSLRPFKRPVDNALEIASYVSLAFCYGILFVGSFTGTGVTKAFFWVFVNCILYLTFIVVLVASKIPTWQQLKALALCEWAKSKERYDSDGN